MAAKHKQNGNNPQRAKAHEPTELRMKILLGATYKIASFNIRGTHKSGVRDETEKWMKKDSINTLGLQETRANQNTRETRKQYTWFSSSERGRKEQTHGVGVIIHNSFMQYIEDIELIDDRLMYITLRGTMPTTIIITYMPQSDRPYEEQTRIQKNYKISLADRGT